MKRKLIGGIELTEDQHELIINTYNFAKEVLSPGARQRDVEGRFDRSIWNKAAEFGLAGLPIPVEHGGMGLDALDTILMVEALGRGCEDAGLVFSLCAHMFASAVPLYHSKSDFHIKYFMQRIASGKMICCNATSEPDAGSDVYSMRTHAELNEKHDYYVINGTKCFITNSPIADMFLVYASTNPSRGYLGISAFLLPKDHPGMRVVPEATKMGLRTSPWGTIYFEDCLVDVATRVGPEGSGAAQFGKSMVWERACLFAMYVGMMDRVVQQCIDHAKERKQFGKSIGSFQSVSNRIVDMKMRLETSRLLVYQVGLMTRAGRRCDDLVAMSKLHISEAAVQTGLDAIQIYGGLGITPDSGVDALLRDALPSRVFSGTSDIQRIIIANSLGLK